MLLKGTANVGNLIASGLHYPTTDGANGAVLTTNGAGYLSWANNGLDLKITDGANTGNVYLSTNTFGILGNTNQIISVVNGNNVTLSLANNLTLGNISNTTIANSTLINPYLVNATATSPNNLNSVVRLTDLVSIPSDLAITAIGSLDLQMTVANPLSANVDSSGTPSYISSLSGSSATPPAISGNASSLGQNYTVMNAYYNANTYKTSGSVTLILDIAAACGLQNNQYVSGSSGPINPQWKGNYNISAFSALFKMRENNFWDYAGDTAVNSGAFGTNPAPNSTWEYAINMTPVTTDPNSSDYGKYTVSTQIYAAAYYHNANLGARWMGLANKYRNLTG